MSQTSSKLPEEERPREAHGVFTVLNSGSVEELFNVTPEQAAQFLELHPHVHIFEGETDVQDQAE